MDILTVFKRLLLILCVMELYLTYGVSYNNRCTHHLLIETNSG